MTTVTLAETRPSIVPFIALSMAAGTTAGMLKALSPVFALRLGASPTEIGMIASAESFGMAIMTLPAGILISRYGARRIYALASLMIAFVFTLVPWVDSWVWLALGSGLGSACMPFRVVGLNSSFLERLSLLGRSRAGWFGAAMTTGMLVIGPALAAMLLKQSGVVAAYLTVAGLFGMMGMLGSRSLLPRQNVQSGLTLKGTILASFALLRRPEVRAICVIDASSGVTLAFFSSFIVVTAIQLVGLSETTAISIRLFEGIVAVCTSFILGHVVQNRHPVHFYRVSLGLIVGGLGVLGFADTYPMLIAATLLLGIGLGLTNLVNILRVASIAVEKSRVSSLQMMSSMSGAFVGALVAGLLAKFVGLHGMFLCGGLIYAVLASRWCWRPKDA